MEVFVPCNTSTRQDLRHNTGSSVDPHNASCCSAIDLNLHELKTCLAELYQIQDTRLSTSGFCISPDRNAMNNFRIDHEIKRSNKCTMSSSASDKLLINHTTFMPHDDSKTLVKQLSSITQRRESDLASEVPEVNEQSMPAALKLVPAMKGSREKQGIAPKKLSVTWASDVYDPVPTSISHVPSDKNQRSGNKRYGKNKQKGCSQSMRGRNSKDKKQTRKK